MIQCCEGHLLSTVVKTGFDATKDINTVYTRADCLKIAGEQSTDLQNMIPGKKYRMRGIFFFFK